MIQTKYIELENAAIDVSDSLNLIRHALCNKLTIPSWDIDELDKALGVAKEKLDRALDNLNKVKS